MYKIRIHKLNSVSNGIGLYLIIICVVLIFVPNSILINHTAVANTMLPPFACSPINYSESVRGSPRMIGKQICYNFDGLSGQKINILLNNQYASLLLTNPDETTLAFCDFNSSDCELDDVTLLQTGIHTLIINGYKGNVGDYSLNLSCQQNCFPNLLPPSIEVVLPDHGYNDFPSEIDIHGADFISGAIVRLDTTTLSTTFVSPSLLEVVIPAGLPATTYDIQVLNPDGGSAILNNAYTIWDREADNDDLFSLDHEFWSTPQIFRASQNGEIGLLVRRVGGKQTLSDVKVHFYQNDPNNGGVFIGEGRVPFLSPHGYASTTAVSWIPDTVGSYTLFAIIDPDNAIAENNETNNIVSRTIEVRPLQPDQIPPIVNTFTINDGASSTSSLLVQLKTTATDPEPSTGVDSLFFVEYEYHQSAALWIPVQNSGWVKYATAHANYPWQLLPSAGVKYLQVWAVDGAGNISLSPGDASISYIPPSDTIAKGQSRIYRYQVNQGEHFTAQLTPVIGDPDLYIWAPDHATRPPWISNMADGIDEVSFIAPMTGIYQIEVYGFTTSTYQLNIEILSNVSHTNDPIFRTQVAIYKSLPIEPAIPLESKPSQQILIPAPTQPNFTLYVPFVIR